MLDQGLAHHGPRLRVGFVVLALQLQHTLERELGPLHISQCADVRRQLLHLKEHVPGVLHLHDGTEEPVERCGADRVIGAVGEHVLRSQLAHLVLDGVDQAHSELLDLDRVAVFVFLKHRNHDMVAVLINDELLHCLDDLAPFRQRPSLTRHRGHMLVVLLLIP